MVNHGKLSTILITITGAILAAIIAQPTIIATIMGNTFLQYGGVTIAIIIAIYNAYCPRNPIVPIIPVTSSDNIEPPLVSSPENSA